MDANREFFDNFAEIVEDDAAWAFKFQREYNRKISDPDEIYLEIKDSEERRKKKGLAPRLVILPGEERYDEEQARKRNRTSSKRRKTPKKSGSAEARGRTVPRVDPTPEGQAKQ